MIHGRVAMAGFYALLADPKSAHRKDVRRLESSPTSPHTAEQFRSPSKSDTSEFGSQSSPMTLVKTKME
jgi:hypothetical protein